MAKGGSRLDRGGLPGMDRSTGGGHGGTAGGLFGGGFVQRHFLQVDVRVFGQHAQEGVVQGMAGAVHDEVPLKGSAKRRPSSLSTA